MNVFLSDDSSFFCDVRECGGLRLRKVVESGGVLKEPHWGIGEGDA